MTRRLIERALSSHLGGSMLRLLESAESRRPNLLRVLTYHRVHEAQFSEQMAYLSNNYNVISAPMLLEVLAGDSVLPPRSVMITFDDAYANFAECAWPILKRWRLSATVFVPTAFPNCPERIFWWDRLEHALEHTPRCDEVETPIGRLPVTGAGRKQTSKRLRAYIKTLSNDNIIETTEAICRELQAPPPPPSDVLSWDDLRQLAGEGVTLGAHTRTHPLMDRVNAEEARAEVRGSIDDLKREIGSTVPIFAYPDGRYNKETLEAVRDFGVRIALTTRRGTNDLRHANPLTLKRINITPMAGLPTLRARLVHSSVYLNRWRRFFDRQ